MKKIFIICSIIAVSFFTLSCKWLNQFKFYTLYLHVEHLNGLKDGDMVYSSAKNVGQVKSIENVNDSSFIVQMSVDKTLRIPKNSEVSIVSNMDNSSSHVIVVFSHSSKYYAEDDTIISKGAVLSNKDIQLHEVDIPLDSLPEGIRTLLRH